MKLTIIDKKSATLKTTNKTLVIDGQKLPFHLIDTLILIGKYDLSSADLITMTQDNIRILLISSNFTQSTLLTAAAPKSAELKLAHYRALTHKPLPIAKWILRQKIQTHINQLKSHQVTIDPAPLMQKIDNAETLDVLLGIEGSFSRSYFSHYFALFPKVLHKGKRSKRPPLDPVNALMSWFYTLFYHLIGVRLIGYGFEAGLGFLHRPFRDHMALASDLLEIFRADINDFVYEIFAKELVRKNDFSKKNGVYLRFEGRKKLYQPFREFHTLLQPRIDTTIADLRSQF